MNQRSPTDGSYTIDRPRLISRLEQEAQHRITVLVAPAGYGKSTILREYVAHAAVQPAVLYRIRMGQSTPAGFVRGLVDTLGPHLGSVPLHEYLYANGIGDEGSLRQWFLQALDRFSGTIGVDDLQVAVAEPGCADFISSIIQESHSAIRWILATRSIGTLPVASWRAGGDAGDPLDESDLRLTANESVRLSRECGVNVSDQVIDHVAGLARGWPAAFAFGIRLAARGVADASVEVYTRSFIDDLFGEQLLSRMTPDQRSFLMKTSLLTHVDHAVIAERYSFDAEALLQALRRDAAFVALDPRGGYLYHDLFREYLRRNLRREDPQFVALSVRWAANVLLESGEADAALDLCLDMEDPHAAVELLERAGFLLIESGCIDLAQRAVQRLQATGTFHPIVPALQATLESMHGNHVRAEELFAEAIARADGQLALELRVRLATHRLNRRDTAGASLAIEGCMDAAAPPYLRLGVATIRACIAAREGNAEQTHASLEEAIGLLGALRDETHVAIAHHQIALVLYIVGAFERARSYATSAMHIAERRRVGGVAARTRSVLCAIAGELGNTGVQRQINHDLRVLALASGDPKLRFFSLANLFVIEIEAGHLAAARTIESELHQFDATVFRDSEEALYPAYALRAAWEGEFGVAQAYLRGTEATLSPENRKLLRQCEVALYAAASGELTEAQQSVEAALGTFARWGGNAAPLHSRALTARILLSLSCALLDDYKLAAELLETVRYAAAVQRRAFDRLIAAARAFVRARSSGDDRMAVPLARLRDCDLGGYALLLESLRSVPSLRPFGDAPSVLTPAERAVLDRLSRGLTSKEIAAAFGKSRYTIDTQVKSIVKKFGCSGRGEAVYLARRYGMLE